MGESFDFGAAVAAIADLTCEVRMWSDVAAAETGPGRTLALERRDEASAKLAAFSEAFNALMLNAVRGVRA